MAGDHGTGLQLFEFVECRYPFEPVLWVSLRHIGMYAVVGGIPGHDEINGRHVQSGGQGRISVAGVDRDQFVPLQVKGVPFKRFRQRDLLRKLTGKAGNPEAVKVGRIELTTHVFYDVRPRHRPRLGKALLKQSDAEEVIAMVVGQVDRGEVLATGCDPIRQRLRGFCGEKGIDQNSIPLTVNECR